MICYNCGMEEGWHVKGKSEGEGWSGPVSIGNVATYPHFWAEVKVSESEKLVQLVTRLGTLSFSEEDAGQIAEALLLARTAIKGK